MSSQYFYLVLNKTIPFGSCDNTIKEEKDEGVLALFSSRKEAKKHIEKLIREDDEHIDGEEEFDEDLQCARDDYIIRKLLVRA